MASLRSKFYSGLLRIFVKNRDTDLNDIDFVREQMENSPLKKFIGPSTSANVETFYIDHLPADWVGKADSKNVILYFHGGGYIVGSRTTHRSMVRQLCKEANCRALLIDYRLAPEHPFPAALDDAYLVYDWLMAQGYGAENIFIAGDSAGAGLTLACLLKLRDEKKPLPRAAGIFSPWTDLTASGDSVKTRDARDPMLSGSKIPDAAEIYAAGEDLTHPYISPLFADLTGLPPLFVQVGTEEVLFDDADRLVKKAKEAGVQAELEIWQGMPHVHQIAHKLVPEARQALKTMGQFFRQF
jgi:epsilon-lactone hydrolase